MERIHRLIAASLAVITVAAGTARLHADETVDSAKWLLTKATLVHRDGGHNVLLRALRQLRDPQLQPLFQELTRKPSAEMRIHGILALAEINEPEGLDLALVAEVDQAPTQAQLITAAMEGDLLDLDTARQLVAWEDLDMAVRALVAADLVAGGEVTEPLRALLDEADDLANPAVRAIAALLRMQLGDEDAADVLRELNDLPSPRRDEVIAVVLKTAMKHRFSNIAPWAMEIARDATLDRVVQFQALRTAIEFDAPEAVELWSRRFDVETSAAQRIRRAILGLQLAEQLGPDAFTPLISSDRELIAQVGRTGRAIAAGQPATAEVLDLIELNHPLASQWALQYARELPAEDAQPILVGIILAIDGPPRLQSLRVESTVFATQVLIEDDPNGEAVLRSLIEQTRRMDGESEQIGELMQSAILMGLIRSRAEDPYRVIEHVDEFVSPMASAMALLLKAKSDRPLSDAEMEQLALIVRGGPGLREPLRLQAAWSYLKRTRQQEVALADVLSQ